jgi:hypothetical protein
MPHIPQQHGRSNDDAHNEHFEALHPSGQDIITVYATKTAPTALPPTPSPWTPFFKQTTTTADMDTAVSPSKEAVATSTSQQQPLIRIAGRAGHAYHVSLDESSCHSNAAKHDGDGLLCMSPYLRRTRATMPESESLKGGSGIGNGTHAVGYRVDMVFFDEGE